MSQKKYHDGKNWFPLTVQKEILAMRKEIENNAQHAGQKFELVKKAYDEIRDAMGQAKSKYTAGCSGCILGMNQILINWFNLYDKASEDQKRGSNAPEFKPLIPSRKTEGDPATPTEVKEPSYKELLERFNAEVSPEAKEKLLAGRKTPKKDELIKYFNGK